MTWIYYALLCSILISVSALFQKKILFQEHAIEFCFVVALYNAVLTTPLLIAADFSSLNLGIILTIFVCGTMSAVSFLLSAKAVRHMEVSVSSPFFATVPVVTALLAFFFLGEHITPIQSIGIMLVAIGCYLLQVRPGSGQHQAWKNIFGSKYVHFLIIASWIYGTTSIMDRLILAQWDVPPTTYVPLLHIVILLVTVIIIKSFYTDMTIIPRGFDSHGLIILLVAFFTVGYRFAQMQALSTGYAGPVIAIKYSSVLITTIIGVELYKEGGLKRKIFASCIILVGILLAVL
jgi:drug/metabolite transporter (DMT)-like permease